MLCHGSPYGFRTCVDGMHGTGTWPSAAEAMQTRTICVPGVPSPEVGILSLLVPAVPDVPGILDGQSGRSGRSGRGRSAQGEAAKFHLPGTAGSRTKVNPSNVSNALRRVPNASPARWRFYILDLHLAVLQDLGLHIRTNGLQAEVRTFVSVFEVLYIP